MNPADREPLSSEERALAERLARDGSGQPSAALDTAILAAAHAAGASPAMGAAPATVAAVRAKPQSRRWPFTAGIAASLALAVGVAWQLRPMPDADIPQTWSEAPAPAASARMPAQPAAAPAPPAAATMADEAVSNQEAAAIQSMESVAEPPATELSPEPQPQAAPKMESSAQPPTESVESPVTAERAVPPSATDTAPTPAAQPTARGTALGTDAFPAPAIPTLRQLAPAPPAPPPPPAPAPDAMPAANDVMRRPAAAAPSSSQRARTTADAVMLESIDDVPDDADPPATADAPEVRAAWLARVRELLDAGKIEAARASLAEFHRRHPQADLPPDLRALLD